ncbi:MAG: UbiX family flavin prenyltransferase [Desulfobulbaceae bacterium]|uniref:Flavin prenyltransferase UbiX n=1 Tax=Candidatus Desulfatifera sulfidica TaxID=2841691 RepID=A0A8J6NAX7_9BACT|nr:UbiX family flavin prenyltransferase [Candidatus Desulfatifera sulfidica]
MKLSQRKKILVAVTGASGMLYLDVFLTELARLDVEVHGICSSAGRQVLALEQGRGPEELPAVSRWFDEKDFAAPPSSGSSGYQAMVVLPCSMGSLAAIAQGLSTNLIHRSADVVLKERKRLVLVVRETPFNRTHLKNMLAVHDAGGVICPPLPSLYFKPETLEEAARTFAWRLADQIGLDIPGRRRWADEVC